MSNEHAKLPYLVQDTLKQLSVKHSIVLYRGLVLDVSSLSHPGGNQLLKPFLMADITQPFNQVGHSHNARRLIEFHAVGRTCNEDSALKTLQELLDSEQERMHRKLMAKVDLTKAIKPQVECMTEEQLKVFLNTPNFNQVDLQIQSSLFLDRLQRNPFWRNMVFCAMAITVLLWLTVSQITGNDDIIKASCGFGVGLFIWAWIEYYFHRFEFHGLDKYKSVRSGGFIGHGLHHAFPQQRTIIVVSIHRILLYLVGMHILFSKVVALPLCSSFAIMLGILCGLTHYDALHYFFHFGWEPTWPFIMELKKNHLKHHFKDSERGFGVSTTLWDRILKTQHVK